MKSRVRLFQALLFAAVAAGAGGCGGEKTARDPETPSGYAVPRYLVLKFDEVNARSGPSEDHAIIGVYHAQGMPVQVIAETKDWRRICDPLGEIAWVAARMLDGERAVIRMKPGAAPIRRAPRADASQTGTLPERGRALVERCDARWCQVKVAGKTGWVSVEDVWGADPAPQCKGLPAPVLAPPA